MGRGVLLGRSLESVPIDAAATCFALHVPCSFAWWLLRSYLSDGQNSTDGTLTSIAWHRDIPLLPLFSSSTAIASTSDVDVALWVVR